MKLPLIFLLVVGSFGFAFGQDKGGSLLSEFSANACSCIDSIVATGKAKEEISIEISKCLRKQVVGYQFGSKLASIDTTSGKKSKKKKHKKTVEISLDLNEDSEESKKYYFELERYTLSNCKSLAAIVNTDNRQVQGDHSFSANENAKALYTKGLADLDSKDYKQAIEDFRAAVKIDSLFSFAWDNLGIAYRKSDQYDKALEAYKKSIAVNPSGRTPWQNIAIVYEYKKEYQKAVEAYQQLALLDKDNPEVYYGIGRVYAFNLADLEKGLDNLCIAYTIYIAQKSPYRSDAEKAINYVYGEMKKQGKEKRFQEILKAHNITSN